MGIRETLNKNAGLTTAATIAIIVIAMGLILWSQGDSGMDIPTKAFYTVDDGASWFSDDINKIPPFDHDGKQAVRAHVYTCDGGKTKWVAYLERYTPEAKKSLEEAAKAGPNQNLMALEQTRMMGVEVKKPKGEKWFKQMDPAAMQATSLKCPDGTTNNLELVLP